MFFYKEVQEVGEGIHHKVGCKNAMPIVGKKLRRILLCRRRIAPYNASTEPIGFSDCFLWSR